MGKRMKEEGRVAVWGEQCVKEKRELCENKRRKTKVWRAVRRAGKIKQSLDKERRDHAMEREV